MATRQATVGAGGRSEWISTSVDRAACPGTTVARRLVRTPIGPLSLSCSAVGVVAIQPADGAHRGSAAGVSPSACTEMLERVEQALERYFSPGYSPADGLAACPVDWAGWSQFAQRVGQALQGCVRLGQTITYGELAERVGRPGAARAIGRVMAANPVPLIVPCHRVVSRGGLRGFAWGLDTKRFLLAWEATAAC